MARLLRAHQSNEPDALAETLMSALVPVGGHDVVLYLVDYEHAALLPHPDVSADGRGSEVASMEGSMAGRAFTTASCQATQREGGWRIWIPMRERANDLGVLAFTAPQWNDEIEQVCLDIGLAAAYLLMASARYTDLPHVLRRRQRMDLAAEMQWSLLPPLSFAIKGTTLSGLVEPAYEVGGDAFDYAYNSGILDIALFDTIGHGLASATLAALAVGAYRQSRRAGMSLPMMAGAIDEAMQSFPASPVFATAVLGRLDVDSGRLEWITCGHPQPILTRDGICLDDDPRVVPGLPLGLGAQGSVIGSHNEIALQPGDGLLLYSDGIVEARNEAGEPFGEDRLRDLLARQHRETRSAQETVRRLSKPSLEHSANFLQDDATLLYLRWTGK